MSLEGLIKAKCRLMDQLNALAGIYKTGRFSLIAMAPRWVGITSMSIGSCSQLIFFLPASNLFSSKNVLQCESWEISPWGPP